MIIELAISTQVKVRNHENEVLWRHFTVAVLSFELAQLLGANEAAAVAIYPLESSVGLEVSNCCQDLPHFLNGELLLSYEQ